MPKKICPECQAKHGTRKKQCDCGFDFTDKRAHPLVPEPGGWVADMPRGMPAIEMPNPPKGPLDVGDVREIVAYEGIGFSIYSLVPAARIKDRKLRGLWVKARAAMQKVVEELYDVCDS